VPLHLAERAFALHLLLQRLQRLVDVIVANENLDDDTSSYRGGAFTKGAADTRTPLLCPPEGETGAAPESYMGPVTYPANIAPDDSAESWAKDAEARLLAEALKLAPDMGWTWRTAYAAGAAVGFGKGETELLLPAGPRDLAALWSRACDAAAMAKLAEVDPRALKIRERIRSGALARLEAAMAHAAATRRWAGFLALPTNAALALRLAWESADVIWRWAGDTATDANHYTKRALLAGILTGTLLVWLSKGEAAAEAHLDRRIENVMSFERLKARVGRLELGRAAAGALGRLRYGVIRL
jgi:ubiquinone biosynthesis protein COQ9